MRLTESLDSRIHAFLPFRSDNGVWRRITELETENKQVLQLMHTCADQFREIITEPRALYLSVQQVRSLTVYIRWRRKGVRGRQGYVRLQSPAGQAFLLRQSPDVQACYWRFDRWALALNLAHSLRLNEIRRLKKYDQDRRGPY
jgi:hypothetical protein